MPVTDGQPGDGTCRHGHDLTAARAWYIYEDVPSLGGRPLRICRQCARDNASGEKATQRRDGVTAAEHAAREALEQEGWSVLKSGWPDFFCERDGEWKLVEVKRRGGQLSPSQQRMFGALRSVGAVVEVIYV